MTLITKFPEYCLSGNIPNLRLTSLEESVKISIRLNEELLFESRLFFGDNGMTNMTLSKLITDALHTNMPVMASGYDIHPSATVTILADDIQIASFIVFKGTVKGALVNQVDWLKSHFLTGRPDTEKTVITAPQWLTYCCVGNATVYANVTCNDGITHEILLKNMTPGVAYDINCSFPAIYKNVDAQPLYWDVYVKQEDVVVTRSQRFVLCPDTATLDVFIAYNTCGGWDTLLFTGARTSSMDVSSSVAESEDNVTPYNVTEKTTFTKRTGILNAAFLSHYEDCLSSVECYHATNDGISRIVIDKVDAPTQLYQPAVWSFDYWYASSDSRTLSAVDMPDGVEIAWDVEDRMLVKQLAQAKPANLIPGLTIPVQYLHSPEWRWMSLSKIFEIVDDQLKVMNQDHRRCKGFFRVLYELNQAYPSPKVGDWAIVWDYIYNCEYPGVWLKTNKQLSVNVNLEEYMDIQTHRELEIRKNILIGGTA